MKRWGWGGGMNSTSGVTGSRYRRPFTVRIRCRHQLDNGCPAGWGANPELQVRMIVQYQGEPWNKGLWRVKPRSSGGKRPDFRMRKKGFFSYLSCLCRFKGVQGNEPIYIINIFILRCRIEPQWAENLCKLLVMSCLYWAIDCTFFIRGELFGLEPV